MPGAFGRDTPEAARRDQLIDEGRALAADGELEAAVEALEEAAFIDPDSAEAHYLLARVRFELGRSYPALDALRLADRLRPNHGPQRLLLGQIYSRLGRTDEAEEIIEEAVVAWPEEPRAHFALGQLRLQQGRLTEAEASLDRAVRMAPRMAGLQELLGRVLLRLGRNDRAIARFEEAIEQRRCDDLALGGRATALMIARQSGRAQSTFQRAIECADPRHELPWRAGLALSHAAGGDLEAASAGLERASELFDAPVSAVLRQRLERRRDGGWTEVGCDAHETICAQASERVWSAALVLFVMGAADVAERELRQAVSLFDGDPLTRWMLAEALAELDRGDEAILELERAAAWQPPEPVAAAMDALRRRLTSEEGEE